MFRTVPLSIIKSFSLNTQQWCMSYSLRAGSGRWNETLHVSDSSSVHHQEFFTVHRTIVYAIQLASRIRTLEWNSTCFGQFLCPSSRGFTVHTAMVYVIQVCWQPASQPDQDETAVLSWSCSQAVWHVSLLCVQWKTPDDGQRKCPKHVEFYFPPPPLPPKKNVTISASSWFYYKNISQCKVTWTSQCMRMTPVFYFLTSDRRLNAHFARQFALPNNYLNERHILRGEKKIVRFFFCPIDC